jgi:hypothetical protein
LSFFELFFMAVLLVSRWGERVSQGWLQALT